MWAEELTKQKKKQSKANRCWLYDVVSRKPNILSPPPYPSSIQEKKLALGFLWAENQIFCYLLSSSIQEKKVGASFIVSRKPNILLSPTLPLFKH